MTIEIVSDVAFNDPLNLIPFVEKDDAIIRPLTKAMLDFSNPECYAGSGAVAVNTKFNSLTSDAAQATANTAFPAVAGGLLQFAGLNPKVTLPDSFKLPNTTKKFLVILWVKLPASGWQTASANVYQSLLSYAANTSTLCQWAIGLTTVQATGAAVGLVFTAPISGGSAGGASLTSGDTLALCDGGLHQVACLFDGESAAGFRQLSIYVDKTQKNLSVSSSWDGSFNTPAATPTLGMQTAFQANYPTDGVYLGRPSLWNLTGSGKSVAEILAADWDAAQGFLS